MSLLNPKVIRDLNLARHGLRIVERPLRDHVGGVGHCDQDDVVVAEPDRQCTEPTRDVLRQQARGSRVDLEPAEVEIVESVLVGERLGNLRARRKAVAHEDLAEPATARLLLGERGFELLERDCPVAEEQRPQLRPALSWDVEIRRQRRRE